MVSEYLAANPGVVESDEGSDYYHGQFNITQIFPYEGMYIMLIEVIAVSGGFGKHRHDGLLQTQLAFSRDLETWTRVEDRSCFIPVGRGAALDGFAAIQARDEPGSLTTKPMILTATHLIINAACGDDGYVAVEALDAAGNPLDGFTLEEADRITGDSVRHLVTWKDNPNIGKLSGCTVRLRFHVKDARLYSFAPLK